MRPRLMLAQSQPHFLRLGECQPQVSPVHEGCGWGCTRPHAHVSCPRCCENCGISFSGDGTRRQRLKTLCKDCRGEWPLGHWEVEPEQAWRQSRTQVSGWRLNGRCQDGGSHEVRYLMLPSHFCSTPSLPTAQRIAFNREQRMFKVSTTCFLLTSVRWEQDVIGAGESPKEQ